MARSCSGVARTTILLSAVLLRTAAAQAAGASAKLSPEELASKYVVGVVANETKQPDASASPPASKLRVVRDAAGRSYSCQVPVPAAAEGQEAVSAEPEASPSQLLAPLDSLCLYRSEDWWTYEICPGRHVRQFHQQGNTLMSQYQLGKFDSNVSRLDEIQQGADESGAEEAFVREVYAEGEPCDLTLNPRSAEVHYTCAEGREVVLSIREPATCAYIFTVGTSRLCPHPAFRSEDAPAATVTCQLESLGKQPGVGLGFGGPMRVRGGGRQGRIDGGATGKQGEMSASDDDFEEVDMPLWQKPLAWLGRTLQLGIPVSAQEAEDAEEAEPALEPVQGSGEDQVQDQVQDQAFTDEAAEAEQETATEDTGERTEGAEMDDSAVDALAAELQQTLEGVFARVGQDEEGDPALQEQAMAELTAKMEAALAASQAAGQEAGPAESESDEQSAEDQEGWDIVNPDPDPAHVEEL